MTTLTIKINERSKKGKAFLEFATTFFSEGNDVEIIESDGKKSKENYSKKFIEKIERAEKNIQKGETVTLNPEDVWGSLKLK